MLRLCLSIAASIAWAQLATAARAQEPALLPPEPPIQRFFVPGAVVDGVPTYDHEWRVWTGREWVPLTSREGARAVFGIKPGPEPHPIIPAPPIAKHQKRLE